MSTHSLLEQLASRRSIREFESTPIEKHIIDDIIRDGQEAPTSCNHQMTHVIAVQDQQIRDTLVHIAGANKHIAEAPVALVITFQKGFNHNKFAVVQSAAAMAYHMCLSAHLRGYATVWNAGLGSQEKVASLLKLPKHFEVVAIVCIGHPKSGTPTMKAARRPLEEIRSWDTFSRIDASIYPLRDSNDGYPYESIRIDKNKYAIFSPKKWGWEKIANLRSYAVFAKSPVKGVYISRRFKKEMEKEADMAFEHHTGERFLEIMPYGGSYTTALLQRGISHIHIAELSQHNIDFIKERVQQEGFDASQVIGSVMKHGILPYEDNSFDTIFIPQILESVPDRKAFLNELHRVLKPRGRIIITVRNMLSWFGVYFIQIFSKGQVRNFGPFIPLVSLRIFYDIRKIYRVIFDFGLTFLPKTPGKKETGMKKYLSRLYGMVVTKQ